MILCLSPNPALDRTLVIDQLIPGGVFRATQISIAADGKGVNVARAARTLGAKVVCAGFLGGATGQQVAASVAAEGMDGAWTYVQGETRTDIIIVDKAKGEATVINEPGPTVTDEDWRRLHDSVMKAVEKADAVCVSGSIPPGTNLDLYMALLQSLYMTGRPVWIDSSGPSLVTALKIKGLNIKINGDEAGAIFSRPIDTPEAAIVAAEQLRENGATAVALTLGKQGAALATSAGRWWVRPPKVKALSAVGSGDTFLAGLVASLLAGLEPKEALRRAAAAGAANAIQIGSGHFDIGAFEQILVLTACGEI